MNFTNTPGELRFIGLILLLSGFTAFWRGYQILRHDKKIPDPADRLRLFFVALIRGREGMERFRKERPENFGRQRDWKAAGRNAIGFAGLSTLTGLILIYLGL